MRDGKGRFIRGHIPVNSRDPVTGRFISDKTVEFIVVKENDGILESKVDSILREKGRL